MHNFGLSPSLPAPCCARSLDTPHAWLSALQAGDAGSGHQRVQLPPLFTIKRSHPAAHRYQVTSLVWYPVDTGLFVTGSADQDVKVWDTNM